jgi:Arc/MetJ family transcription regulator
VILPDTSVLVGFGVAMLDPAKSYRASILSRGPGLPAHRRTMCLHAHWHGLRTHYDGYHQVYGRGKAESMRTNIVLDDRLVGEAMRLSGINTKKGVVDAALRDFVAVRSRKNLMDLKGKIRFADGYDYKETRRSGG